MAWASCGVTLVRSVEAILGRSGRANIIKKRPLASKLAMPFGFAPKSCCLVPSLLACSHDTSVQVPASWSLTDFVWATAPLSGRARPNAVIIEIFSASRRFMVFLPVHIFRALENTRESWWLPLCACVVHKFSSHVLIHLDHA